MFFERKVFVFRSTGAVKNPGRRCAEACLKKPLTFSIPRKITLSHSASERVRRDHVPAGGARPAADLSQGKGARDEKRIAILDSQKAFPCGGLPRIFARGLFSCYFSCAVMS